MTNDGSEESWVKLIECKVLFGRQLPRMPKEYIVRLLFDQRHFCFCLRRGGKIIAACCFRPFASLTSLEIAFLAVQPGEQVQGHGTRLMNALKSYAQAQGVTDLVTYADVAAVGYFSKQGFFPCDKASLPKEWDGHIKDYDGAYLKRCRIYPNVDYLSLPQYVMNAKAEIWRDCLATLNPLRRAGLPQRPARIEDIPGVTLSQPIKSLEAQISDIIESAYAHKSSWPFQQPVDIKEAPDYQDVVQCPTDLSTMRKRNAQRGFRTAESFKLELKLMFDNCYLYNGHGSIYAREASALEKLVMPRVERLCRREEEEKDDSLKRDSLKKRKN